MNKQDYCFKGFQTSQIMHLQIQLCRKTHHSQSNVLRKKRKEKREKEKKGKGKICKEPKSKERFK